MRAHGQTLRRNELVIPRVNLGSVKAWAKATFTKERVAEAGVVAAALVLTGYLGAVIFKGIETCSMTGF